jgi:hypothetical protein
MTKPYGGQKILPSKKGREPRLGNDDLDALARLVRTTTDEQKRALKAMLENRAKYMSEDLILIHETPSLAGVREEIACMKTECEKLILSCDALSSLSGHCLRLGISKADCQGRDSLTRLRSGAEDMIEACSLAMETYFSAGEFRGQKRRPDWNRQALLFFSVFERFARQNKERILRHAYVNARGRRPDVLRRSAMDFVLMAFASFFSPEDCPTEKTLRGLLRVWVHDSPTLGTANFEVPEACLACEDEDEEACIYCPQKVNN